MVDHKKGKEEVKEPQRVQDLKENNAGEIELAPVPDQNMISDIQKMINEAVQGALKEALKGMTPAAQLGESALPVEKQAAAPNVPQQAPYKPRLKGIPVEPGQDLRHVHPNTIKQWFASLEQRWKENFQKKVMDGSPSSLSLTRG